MNPRSTLILVAGFVTVLGVLWFVNQSHRSRNSSPSIELGTPQAGPVDDNPSLGAGSGQRAFDATSRIPSTAILEVQVLVKLTPNADWVAAESGELKLVTDTGDHSHDLSGPLVLDGRLLAEATRIIVESSGQRAFAVHAALVDQTFQVQAWMYPGILVDAPGSQEQATIEIVRSTHNQQPEATLIHPGRINEQDRRGTRELPAYLPWDGEWIRPYWIRTPSGPWTRVIAEEGAHATLAFHLPERCAGSVDIAVLGADRGYALRFLATDATGSLLIDYQPLVVDRKLLTGVPPFTGRLLFGYGTAVHIRENPIETIPINVICDEVSHVDLVIQEQTTRRGSIEGTLTIPGLGLLDGTDVRDRIVLALHSADPLLHAARGVVIGQAFREMRPAAEESRLFALGPVPFGVHTLEVLPFGYTQEVSVFDESGVEANLTLPAIARARIRVSDAARRSVTVQSLVVLRGEPGMGRRQLPVSETQAGEWEAVLPCGTMIVEVATADHGYTSEQFEVSPGWNDFVVTVERSFGRSLHLVRDGEVHRAPVDWWFGIRVTRESGEGGYENRTMVLNSSTARLGVSKARFLFSGPGRFRLQLPKLPGTSCPDSVILRVSDDNSPLEIEVGPE